MSDFFKNEKYPLLIIFCLFVLTLILTWGTNFSIVEESAKEIFIPYAMSQGSAPYKDIFCENMPFGYLLGAFFLKIFGSNLNVLSLLSALFSLTFLAGFYAVCREFLSKLLSSALCTFVLYATVFAPVKQSLISANSFTEGICQALIVWILYLAIKFIKEKSTKILNIIMLLFGTLVMTKSAYFVLVLPLMGLFFIDPKKENIKTITYFAIIPLLGFAILAFWGVNFSDIFNNLNFAFKVSHSNSMDYFLNTNGILRLNPKILLQNCVDFVGMSVVFILFLICATTAMRKLSNKLSYTFLFVIFCIAYCILGMVFENNHRYFSYLPLLCFAIFGYYSTVVIRSKNLKQTNILCVLTLLAFAILSSFRVIFSLNLEIFGAYHLPLLMLCVLYFLDNVIKTNFLFNSKNQCEVALVIFLSIFTLNFADNLQTKTIKKEFKLRTPKITCKVEKGALTLKETMDYLDKISTNEDKILALPSGAGISLALGRNYNFYQPNFMPPIVEGFSQNAISEEIADKKPDYVIFTNESTKKYGTKHLCASYGMEICKTVLERYNLEAAFGDELRIYLFKIKENNEK